MAEGSDENPMDADDAELWDMWTTGFDHLLTQAHLEELGSVDEDWFEHLSDFHASSDVADDVPIIPVTGPAQHSTAPLCASSPQVASRHEQEVHGAHENSTILPSHVGGTDMVPDVGNYNDNQLNLARSETETGKEETHTVNRRKRPLFRSTKASTRENTPQRSASASPNVKQIRVNLGDQTLQVEERDNMPVLHPEEACLPNPDEPPDLSPERVELEKLRRSEEAPQLERENPLGGTDQVELPVVEDPPQLEKQEMDLVPAARKLMPRSGFCRSPEPPLLTQDGSPPVCSPSSLQAGEADEPPLLPLEVDPMSISHEPPQLDRFDSQDEKDVPPVLESFVGERCSPHSEMSEVAETVGEEWQDLDTTAVKTSAARGRLSPDVIGPSQSNEQSPVLNRKVDMATDYRTPASSRQQDGTVSATSPACNQYSADRSRSVSFMMTPSLYSPSLPLGQQCSGMRLAPPIFSSSQLDSAETSAKKSNIQSAGTFLSPAVSDGNAAVPGQSEGKSFLMTPSLTDSKSGTSVTPCVQGVERLPPSSSSPAFSPWLSPLNTAVKYRPQRGLYSGMNIAHPLSITPHVIKSLGIDHNMSGASWTSSLATPPRNKSMDAADVSALDTLEEEDFDERKLSLGAARMLFSPGNLSQSSQDTDMELNDTIESSDECEGAALQGSTHTSPLAQHESVNSTSLPLPLATSMSVQISVPQSTCVQPSTPAHSTVLNSSPTQSHHLTLAQTSGLDAHDPVVSDVNMYSHPPDVFTATTTECAIVTSVPTMSLNSSAGQSSTVVSSCFPSVVSHISGSTSHYSNPVPNTHSPAPLGVESSYTVRAHFWTSDAVHHRASPGSIMACSGAVEYAQSSRAESKTVLHSSGSIRGSPLSQIPVHSPQIANTACVSVYDVPIHAPHVCHKPSLVNIESGILLEAEDVDAVMQNAYSHLPDKENMPTNSNSLKSKTSPQAVTLNMSASHSPCDRSKNIADFKIQPYNERHQVRGVTRQRDLAHEHSSRSSILTNVPESPKALNVDLPSESLPTPVSSRADSLKKSEEDNGRVDVDDVLSIFSTPPTRAGLRKRLAPRRRSKIFSSPRDQMNKTVPQTEEGIVESDMNLQPRKNDCTMNSDSLNYPTTTQVTYTADVNTDCQGGAALKSPIRTSESADDVSVLAKGETSTVNMGERPEKSPCTVASAHDLSKEWTPTSKLHSVNSSRHISVSPVDIAFSQISPTSLHAMVEVADISENKSIRDSPPKPVDLGRNSSHDGSKVLPGVEPSTVKLPSPSVVQKRYPTMQPRRLSLGSKPKKFAYPSTKQISKTCPRKVFNFGVPSVAPAHVPAGQDVGTVPAGVESTSNKNDDVGENIKPSSEDGVGVDKAAVSTFHSKTSPITAAGASKVITKNDSLQTSVEQSEERGWPNQTLTVPASVACHPEKYVRASTNILTGGGDAGQTNTELGKFHVLATSSTTEVVEDVAKSRNSQISANAYKSPELHAADSYVDSEKEHEASISSMNAGGDCKAMHTTSGNHEEQHELTKASETRKSASVWHHLEQEFASDWDPDVSSQLAGADLSHSKTATGVQQPKDFTEQSTHISLEMDLIQEDKKVTEHQEEYVGERNSSMTISSKNLSTSVSDQPGNKSSDIKTLRRAMHGVGSGISSKSDSGLIEERPVETVDVPIVGSKLEENSWMGNTTPGLAVGFSLASGKSVAISEGSRRKAQQLMSEINAEDEHIATTNKASDTTSPPSDVHSKQISNSGISNFPCEKQDIMAAPVQGFSTASGKTISVSDSRLDAAQKMLFEDGDDDILSDNIESKSIAGECTLQPSKIMDDIPSEAPSALRKEVNQPPTGKVSHINQPSAVRSLKAAPRHNGYLPFKRVIPRVKPSNDANTSLQPGTSLNQKKKNLMGTVDGTGAAISENGVVPSTSKKTAFTDELVLTNVELSKDRRSEIYPGGSAEDHVEIASGFTKAADSLLHPSVLAGQSTSYLSAGVQPEFCEFHVSAASSTTSVVEDAAKTRNSLISMQHASASKSGIHSAHGHTSLDARKCGTASSPRSEMNNNGKPVQSVTCAGFSLASGKLVSLSAAALEKANQLLADVDEDGMPTHPDLGSNAGFSGFATAHGKPIVPSSTAMDKAAKLVSDAMSSENDLLHQDGGVSPDSVNKVTEEVEPGNRSISPSATDDLDDEFEDFTITQMQRITESAAAVEDDLENRDRAPMEVSCTTDSTVKVFSGAGAHESMQKAGLPAGRETTCAVSSASDSLSVKNNITLVGGQCPLRSLHDEDGSEARRETMTRDLTSSQMAEIEVSTDVFFEHDDSFSQIVPSEIEESEKHHVKNAVDVIDDDGTSASDHKPLTDGAFSFDHHTTGQVRDTHPPSTSFMGFQTGHGKPVNVSEEALIKARTMLIDENDAMPTSSLTDVPSLKDGFTKGEVSDHVSGNLKTADMLQGKSGQDQSIPCENSAAGHGASLHSSPDEEITFKTVEGDTPMDSLQNVSSHSTSDPSPVPFLGFQTGRGRQVTISDAALQKARAVLQDELDVVSPEMERPAVHTTAASDESSATDGAFAGFMSAAGKNVHVSESALKHAHTFLSEDTSSTSASESAGGGFVIFQTGSGRRISVSAAALSKSKQLLHDGESEDAEQNASTAASVCFPGFTTGSGKTISVSAAALSKGKQLLCDGEDDSGEVGTRTAAPLSFPGLKTGSGESILMSKAALSKGEQLLCDGEGDDGELTVGTDAPTVTSPPSPPPSGPLDFPSFKTGSGKYVNVSSAALQKARDMLEDNHASPSENKHSPTQDDDAYNKATIDSEHEQAKFTGFQTGAGKKVTVSKAAVESAKHMLASDDTESGTVASPPHLGFHTGSGKAVLVSKDALGKAKQLLSESDSSDAAQGSTMPTASFAGFKSASGKNVTVSKAALEKAKCMLTDVGEDESESAHAHQNTSRSYVGRRNEAETSGENSKACESEAGGNNAVVSAPVAKSGFVGFQTGGGKQIAVSKAALDKAKEIFADNDHVPVAENRESECKPFSGFETGSGKNIKVSASALEKARGILSDCEQMSESSGEIPASSEITKASGGFVGFSTGRGKTIEVSKAAVEKARALVNSETMDGDSAVGFQTGTGQHVKVPQSAVAQAKRFLHAEDDSKTLSGTDHSMNSNDSSAGTSVAARSDDSVNKRQNNAGKAVNNERAASLQTHSSGAATSRQQVPQHRPPTKPQFTTSTVTTSASPLSGQPPADHPSTAPPVNHPTHQMGSSLTDSEEKLMDEETRSLQALVASGLFEESWLSQLDSETASKITKRDVDGRDRQMNPRSKLKATSSIKSSPEGIWEDRDQVSPNAAPQPIRTCPPSDLIWAQKKVSKFQYRIQSDKNTESTAGSTFQTPYRKIGQSGTAVPSTDAKSNSEVASCANKKVEVDSQPMDLTDSECDPSHSERLPDAPASTLVKCDPEVVKQRTRAKVVQAQAISKKKKQGGVKPMKGSLFEQKLRKGRPKLIEAVNSDRPQQYSRQQLYSFGVQPSTLNVSAATAEEFRFNLADYQSEAVARTAVSIQVGDGATVVIDDTGCIGKQEFCNGLLALDCVEPGLISREWVFNHYRWIIWKLAALEVAFPATFGARCLTPEQVMLQLKYRYDREIDHSQRSALKKIFERDDTAAKCMVLCVSAILSAQNLNISPGNEAKDAPAEENKTTATVVNDKWLLELTDGWYQVRGLPDAALCRLIQSRRIHVGDKLAIYGAELLGPQDACPPLEAPADARLKLSVNSTRRARWDARLGFCRQPQPPALSLVSLLPDGGLISCVDVIIARVYPLQYMEKPEEGASTFRNERAENKAARLFDATRQRRLEEIFNKLQQKMEADDVKTDSCKGRGGRRKRWRKSDVAGLQTGQEIYEACEQSYDPADVQQLLSERQMCLLQEYKQRLFDERQTRMRADFEEKIHAARNDAPSRTVVPLMKLRLVGCSRADVDSPTNIMLTIWRPADDLQSMLREGSRFKMYNLLASEGRGRGTGGISLTTGRTTQYEQLQVDDNLIDLVYEPREVSAICDLSGRVSSPFAEVDLVGVVVHIGEPSNREKSNLQVVYIADEREDACAIRFWGGLQAHALEDVVRLKSTLAFTNLQQRETSSGVLVNLTASELSSVTGNPREKYLAAHRTKLTKSIKDLGGFVGYMQTKVLSMLRSGMQRTPTHSAGATVLPSFEKTPKQHSTSHSFTGPVINTPAGLRESNFSCHTTEANDPSKTTVVSSATPRPVLHYPSMNRGSHQTVASCGTLLSRVNNIGAAGMDSVCRTLVATPTPTPHTPLSSVALTTPTEEDVDPVLSAKKSIQRQKMARLSRYGSPPKLAPLSVHSTPVLRKAFKPPRRSITGISAGASPLPSCAKLLDTALHNSHTEMPQTDTKPLESDRESMNVREMKVRDSNGVEHVQSLEKVPHEGEKHDTKSDISITRDACSPVGTLDCELKPDLDAGPDKSGNEVTKDSQNDSQASQGRAGKSGGRQRGRRKRSQADLGSDVCDVEPPPKRATRSRLSRK